jgi:cell division protein FtsB
MNNKTQSSNRLIAILVALQVTTLLAVFGLAPLSGTTVQAQIPDAGSQRIQMIEQLRQMNGKMDQLMRMLEKGDLQVRCTSPDEKK